MVRSIPRSLGQAVTRPSGWSVAVQDLGFVSFHAVVVPSGFRMRVQPHRWMTTWWWNGQQHAVLEDVLPLLALCFVWCTSHAAGSAQPPFTGSADPAAAPRCGSPRGRSRCSRCRAADSARRGGRRAARRRTRDVVLLDDALVPARPGRAVLIGACDRTGSRARGTIGSRRRASAPCAGGGPPPRASHSFVHWLRTRVTCRHAREGRTSMTITDGDGRPVIRALVTSIPGPEATS